MASRALYVNPDTGEVVAKNLNVSGTSTIVDTYTTVSSNISVMNLSGTGPALRVAQTGVGANYPVADFYDNDVSTTVPALRIADGGNVGIGTDTPLQKLHVQGSVKASAGLELGGIPNQGGSGGFRLLRLTPITGTATQMTFDRSIATGAAQNYIYNDENVMEFLAPKFVMKTGNLEVNADVGVGGNVGIGTTNPLQKLHVQGNIQASTQFLGQAADSVNAPSFSWTGDTNVGIYRPATDTLGVVTNGIERMRVDASGNVGIGTANPLQKLHVQGDTIISGSLSAMNMGMFRNRIINGDMRVNQRGFTSASPQTVNGGYSLDRWLLFTGGSPTSVSHGQYTLLSTTDATMYNQGYRFASVVNRGGSGGTAVHFRQYIELNMVEDLYNSVCTISFWARASADGNFNLAFIKMSDGTGATSVGQNFAISVTTSWQRLSVVVPIAAPTSSTGALNSYGVDLLFAIEGLPNATLFYLTGVQLEKGALATPFEFRPYLMELQLCKRYFVRVGFDTPSTNYRFPFSLTRINTSKYDAYYRTDVPLRTVPINVALTATLDKYFPQMTSISTASEYSGTDHILVVLNSSTSSFASVVTFLERNGSSSACVDIIAEL